MPYLVGGTQLHQKNHPSGPPAFDFKHERLPAVEAKGKGHSEGSAKHRAEHALVGRANHPFAIVDVQYKLDTHGGKMVYCNIIGIPVKKLEASGGGRG
ncbi:MAG TPA: hypothetical protein VFH37_01895 [Candidatus Saccharimonadales bacterium]|nr:hypothetical protein [Candidatus Saccharimonadales bacterium]